MIYSVTVTVPRNGSIFLEFFGISDIAHIYTGDKSGHYVSIYFDDCKESLYSQLRKYLYIALITEHQRY